MCSAEMLVVYEAIGEGKKLKKTLSTLLKINNVPLIVGVDSKDLCTSLSTCRNSNEKSI